MTYHSSMKGLIYKAIKWGIKKGSNPTVIQRYLKLKHRISVGKEVIIKRMKFYKQT